jgi:thermostable 8-oxoguanine DNA glycosylase|tara:strand:- start:433 stop:639 length:207 start_codon:yes stop_codon:yes gene_type:complete
MLSFFGHYKTETELEDAMVNTFRTNPAKYLRALARRVMTQDVKCIINSDSIPKVDRETILDVDLMVQN